MKAKDAIAFYASKEKKAGKFSNIGKAVKEFGKNHPVAKGFAIYGMGLPAIYAASSSAIKGISNAYNSAMKGHRMDKMFDVYPDLKEEDQKKVRLAFNTINRLNPDFAADPLISGTWVKRVLDSDVGGGPMVDPHTAGTLDRDPGKADMASMVTRGLEKGLSFSQEGDGVPSLGEVNEQAMHEASLNDYNKWVAKQHGGLPNMHTLNSDLYEESLRDHSMSGAPKQGGGGLPTEVQDKLSAVEQNQNQWK